MGIKFDGYVIDMCIPITYDPHPTKRKTLSGVSVVGSPEGERRGQLPQSGILNCGRRPSGVGRKRGREMAAIDMFREFLRSLLKWRICYPYSRVVGG